MPPPTEEGTYISLELLVPPTTVAGRSAEVARVIQTWHMTSVGLRRAGAPQIEVLWGRTIAQVRAERLQEKARVQALAVAQMAEIDETLTALP